jgi:hypothetical protein
MRRIVVAIGVSVLIVALVLLFGGQPIQHDPRCRLVAPASPPIWWEDACGAVHSGG